MMRSTPFGRRREIKPPATAEELAERMAKLSEKAEKGLVSKELGECQACERRQKLERDRTMVLHGYKRPGWGQIRGRCPGVGHLPYELSCELVKTIRGWTEGIIANLRIALEEAKTGKLDIVRRVTSGGKTVETTRSDPSFPEKLRFYIANLESKLRYEEGYLRHCDERIRSWQPREIKSVIEAEKKKLAMTLERRAAIDARRAARTAKIAAIATKKTELEGKRRELLRGMVESLRSAGSESEALAAWRTMRTKKNEWVWDFSIRKLHEELGLEELALSHGFAERAEWNPKLVFYKDR